MPNLMDFYNTAAIQVYWEEVYSNTLPYIHSTFFPARKQMGLKLEWIKGYNQLPVMLMPSAFDAKPTLRDRGGVTTSEEKMPFFRESMRIGEQDRQNLLTLLATNNTQAIRNVLSRIFDDAGELLKSAYLNPEVMAFQLLQNGTINIVSPTDSGIDVRYQYNYDTGGTWVADNHVTVTTAWSDPAANIVKDYLDMKRKAAADGNQVTRAMMSRKTFNDQLQNSGIIEELELYTAMSDNDLISYLSRKTGFNYLVVEKMYKAWDGTTVPFMEDDLVVFLPDGPVGNMYYGTTPEEADLLFTDLVNDDVRLIDNAIAVGTKMESLPVNIITWVAEIVLPSFERMNEVYVLHTTP